MSRIETRENGSVVIVAMLAMIALMSLGGLSTLAVRGGLASSGHDRFRSIALYAAESGAASATDYLRSRVFADVGWSDYVEPNNNPIFTGDDIPGNRIQPGDLGNLFSPELKAWYDVVILNNIDDPGFALGNDGDHRVVVRSTGHGPGGTVVQIEVEVAAKNGFGGLAPPCAYSQEGMCADNSGYDSGAQNAGGGVNSITLGP